MLEKYRADLGVLAGTATLIFILKAFGLLHLNTWEEYLLTGVFVWLAMWLAYSYGRSER